MFPSYAPPMSIGKKTARAGQTRYESWVPSLLLSEFRALPINKALWLRTQMRLEVERHQAAKANEPRCAHQRIESGKYKEDLGTRIPIYVCSLCGTRLN